MSPDILLLLEGAVLIGDAHYSPKNPQLLPFLKAIAAAEIKTPQLILMGDIFDQLFGGITFTLERNAEAISLINQIALQTDVIYLEGNHDFQLASVFKNIRIFPLQQQPLLCRYGEKKILLAHGDFGLPLGYRLYTGAIRSASVLRILRVIDDFTGHGIVKWVDEHNAKKYDCNRFEGFEQYIIKRLEALDLSSVDYCIEGHYHQNSSFDVAGCVYINLAAFACNQRYFQIQSLNSQKLLKEVTFHKES